VSSDDTLVTKHQSDTPSHQTNETAYLKSKLWWTGFLLLNIGELGNFTSYAFAPASVVAPLGTFALIANCFFAPIILKERFRRSDILGVMLSICGAVTVVYASKSSNPTLDPEALLKAISQQAFIVYASTCAVAALILSGLSNRRAGQEHIFVDVGLCAIFGGFTVLSTKAVSTLISLKSIGAFKEWITYPLILVLVGTGVGQIRYLNRALMKFDGKAVIPTQFVMFNLSAIVGSAVLYRDFDNISPHRFLVFLYGCAATFLGVILLTRPTIPAIFTTPPLSPSEPSTPSSLHPSLSLQNVPNEVTPLLNRAARSSSPIQLRNRNSTASLGLSPGQYLLLVTGSPKESTMPRTRAGSINGDWEPGSASRTTGSIGRRFGVIAAALPQTRSEGDP
jgi:drug/metabolite transporter (DMT)-like permease